MGIMVKWEVRFTLGPRKSFHQAEDKMSCHLHGPTKLSIATGMDPSLMRVRTSLQPMGLHTLTSAENSPLKRIIMTLTISAFREEIAIVNRVPFMSVTDLIVFFNILSSSLFLWESFL